RAPGWVHDRLADLTAAQIGELISTALRANDSALHVTKIDSALHGSGLIITNSALRENDSALQAEASLHVTPEPDAPLSLLVFRRAELSAPQTDLVDALSAGATLKRDLDAAAWILTLKDGTAQRVPTNTVTALQRKGVLST
ncbi:hypothetical protein, partial [Deinococcus aquatilis]|uniref:hypothetical protein n=1 Tax=Deinococcus aquatilis TaxID=519440 RepID=UPI001B7FCBE0